jgi:hypothetical protein
MYAQSQMFRYTDVKEHMSKEGAVAQVYREVLLPFLRVAFFVSVR